MEEDYFERFFLNIWKNSVRMLRSAVAVDRELFVQLQTPATSTTLFWLLSQEDAPQTHLTSWQIARKTGIHRSSAVRIIRDDLLLQVYEKNDAYRCCPKPKQIVSTVCYKINLSWYSVSSKLASYTCEHRRLILCTKSCGYLSLFVEITWK